MTDECSEVLEEQPEDWKVEFDSFQDDFYSFRLGFYYRGAFEIFKGILNELPSLTPEQESLKQCIVSNDIGAFLDVIIYAKAAENISIAYPKLVELYDAGYENNYENAVKKFNITTIWLSIASSKKEPVYYGLEIESCIELPCNFTLHFDHPFGDFDSQLNRHREHALKIYNENKFKKYVFLTDFLKDAEGRKLSMSKLADKWEKCLKVYDLSRKTEYQKKDGTPNLTKIGTDAELYSYAHQHHVVNRTKDYLREAERLAASAWNMTFPD